MLSKELARLDSYEDEPCIRAEYEKGSGSLMSKQTYVKMLDGKELEHSEWAGRNYKLCSCK